MYTIFDISADNYLFQNQPTEETESPTLREYPKYWEGKLIDRSLYWWFRPTKSTSGIDAINMTDVSEDLRESTERKISEKVGRLNTKCDWFVCVCYFPQK